MTAVLAPIRLGTARRLGLRRRPRGVLVALRVVDDQAMRALRTRFPGVEVRWPRPVASWRARWRRLFGRGTGDV